MDRPHVGRNPFTAIAIAIHFHGRDPEHLGGGILPAAFTRGALRSGQAYRGEKIREAVTEYKEIASALQRRGVVSAEEMKLMQKFAGYRNRLVHFYHDVSAEELYEICASRLGDIEKITDTLRAWIKNHQSDLDETL